MTTLVYTDFDGVLLPLGGAPVDKDGRLLGPREPINALNALAEALTASVVISSSWRQFRDLEELRRLMALWGIQAPVVGVTALLPGPTFDGHRVDEMPLPKHRLFEILKDARERRTDRVIVLDDMVLERPEPTSLGPLSWHAIHPAARRGLTRGEVDDLLQTLEER